MESLGHLELLVFTFDLNPPEAHCQILTMVIYLDWLVQKVVIQWLQLHSEWESG